MSEETPWDNTSWHARVDIRTSLMIQLPGMQPFFLEGLKLSVDKLMYDRYSEIGELDKWLHWQAVDFLMKNSTTQRVAAVRL